MKAIFFYLSRKLHSVIIFGVIVFLILLPQQSFATFGQRGPDPRVVGNRNLDLSVYRTVNSLSCHPQNPLLQAFPDLLPGEVPLWVSFNKDKAFTQSPVKGYCIATHFLEYTTPEWVGIPPNPPTGRPDEPWWHYVVIELPNPNYGKATETKFTGKWIHWEGMVINDNSSVSSGNHETWHLYKPSLDTFGGLPAWSSVTTFNETPPYTAFNGTSQPGLRMDHSGVSIKSCQSSVTPTRAGDEGLPCFSYTVDMNADSVGGMTYWNPTSFTDIPHDKWGHVTSNDTSWIKCADQLPANYFTINATADTGFGRKTPPKVYAVTPAGCDYPAMTGNPGAHPVCLDQSQYPADGYMPTKSKTLPRSLEGCRGNNPVDPTPTPTLTPTTSPITSIVCSPTSVVLNDGGTTLTATVKNGTGGLVSGATVLWTTPNSSVSLFQSSSQTDSQGRAQTSALVSLNVSNAFTTTITATVSGVSSVNCPIQASYTPVGPTISSGPTPSYLRSDFGGQGGVKDGIIDIQDFNILAGEFYQTRTTYKADIIRTGDSLNRVDIQDYNAFVSDYQAYLVR